MKKTLLFLFAAAALVGCSQKSSTESGRYGSSTNMNEPAGAGLSTNWSTNQAATNQIKEPSGAQPSTNTSPGASTNAVP